MLIGHASAIRSSEITPPEIYFNRRQFVLSGTAASLVAAIPGTAEGASLDAVPSEFSTEEEPTALRHITNYNNFYEFGVGKEDPASFSHTLTTRPWTITVDGLVSRPAKFDLDDLLASMTLEERIYRLRCVEGWSMVIPWIGFPLSNLLNRVEPLGSAKYVAFKTVYRPEEMPGQKAFFKVLDWPYVEGLRLDEANHPLTILAVGLYGEMLPNQNGAPIRLVVPWKYGFKSIKSVVQITLTEEQPPTSWNLQNSREYGFYSNVNPEVDHPRWSQATELPIGGGLFTSRKPTLMFNGYADQVAHLYTGMDLRKYF